MRSPIKSRAGRKKRGEHSFLNGCSFRGAGITATEIKIGAQHEVLNASSFLASPLAAAVIPKPLPCPTGHTHIVRSQSVHSLLLGPSWCDQSYTVPMPCSGLEKLSPDPFMMHYSTSIASLASPDPIPSLWSALPQQVPGSPSQKVPFRTLPPPHPLNSLRSLQELKPSLSIGWLS